MSDYDMLLADRYADECDARLTERDEAEGATPDERRRVAEELRKGYKGSRPLVTVVLGDSASNIPELRINQLFNRLADLIDPTCEVVTDQVDDGEFGAHEYYECCSNCGNQNMRDRFTGELHNCCPRCGRRVVTGEEDRT